MGSALLVEYYNQLPEVKEGESSRKTAARFQTALEAFRKQVTERYTEGTLQRLLLGPSVVTRRAAVLALSIVGTMDSNAAVAACLHDIDDNVRQVAADALWAIWYRGDSEADARELRRLMRLREPQQAVAGLDALVKKSPNFAEAYNQRAILYFKLKDYQRAIADCERVLKLNPFHFGALSGMAQCHVQLRRPRPALKAYRQAFKIHPGLEGIEETIRALETSLGGGEEGKRDDKK